MGGRVKKMTNKQIFNQQANFQVADCMAVEGDDSDFERHAAGPAQKPCSRL